MISAAVASSNPHRSPLICARGSTSSGARSTRFPPSLSSVEVTPVEHPGRTTADHRPRRGASSADPRSTSRVPPATESRLAAGLRPSPSGATCGRAGAGPAIVPRRPSPRPDLSLEAAPRHRRRDEPRPFDRMHAQVDRLHRPPHPLVVRGALAVGVRNPLAGSHDDGFRRSLDHHAAKSATAPAFGRCSANSPRASARSRTSS